MTTLVLMGLSNAVQFTVLALIVYGATRLIRNAALNRCLWLLVLVKLITPPILGMPLVELPGSWAARETTAMSTSDLPIMSSPPNAQRLPHISNVSSPAYIETPAGRTQASNESVSANRIRSSTGEVIQSDVAPEPVVLNGWSVLGVCWIFGALAWLGVILLRGRRFSRYLRRASAAPSPLQSATKDLAGILGLKHIPDVLTINANLPPFLWGIGRRAVVVVPTSLIEALDQRQLRLIIAHELAHLSRHDLNVRWLEVAATALYWWNPVVWLVRRELRQAEELCCDATAVAVTAQNTRDNARTLLSTACLVADRRLLPQTVCGFGGPQSLKRRIQMIVNSPLDYRLTRRTRLGLLLAAAIVLPLAPFTYAETEDSSPGPIEATRSSQPTASGAAEANAAGAAPASATISSAGIAVTAAAAATTDDGRPGELLIERSFEESDLVEPGVPRRAGVWTGDQSSVVGGEQGISPIDGDHMLRLLSSGPNGPGQGYTACEVFQIVDLTPYAAYMADHGIDLNASAFVNRVHRNDQTDTAMSITVYVCNGSPADFHHNLLTDDTLAEAGSHLHADSDPESWEQLAVSMRLPSGATYLAVRVTAGENIADDAEDELHGHYVDNVSVKISRRARPTTFPAPLRARQNLEVDNTYFHRLFSRELRPEEQPPEEE